MLILTCTGVSFAHGSNDGQKGMGLIMLILIGTVPTAYALNHSVGKDKVEVFVADSARAVTVLEAHGGGVALTGEPRQVLTTTVEKRAPQAQTVPALAKMIADTSASVAGYGTLAAVPTAKTANVRNDMYLISETLAMLKKKGSLNLTRAAAGAISTATRAISTTPPSSSRPGSRSPSPSPLASAPWWAGSASW